MMLLVKWWIRYQIRERTTFDALIKKKHGLWLTHIFDNLYETWDFFPLMRRHFLPPTGSASLTKMTHVNQVFIDFPHDVLLLSSQDLTVSNSTMDKLSCRINNDQKKLIFMSVLHIKICDFEKNTKLRLLTSPDFYFAVNKPYIVDVWAPHFSHWLSSKDFIENSLFPNYIR